MTGAKVLLVDDDEVIRTMLAQVLEARGFEVTSASNVPDALKKISSETYDVLLSDLHMPNVGDGLTVVSAMRHVNPEAVTMIVSAFPEMDAAARAILMQADEILVKPVELPLLVDVIQKRIASGPARLRVVESVATILERAAPDAIDDWYENVLKEETLMIIPLSREERCGHLPELFRDLVYCLRSTRELGNKEPLSFNARAHGKIRRQQGYSPAMMVEESRILQVSIFRTLQNNLASIDFSVLLIGVMTIADEVDYQLSQAVTGYTDDVRDHGVSQA